MLRNSFRDNDAFLTLKVGDSQLQLEISQRWSRVLGASLIVVPVVSRGRKDVRVDLIAREIGRDVVDSDRSMRCTGTELLDNSSLTVFDEPMVDVLSMLVGGRRDWRVRQNEALSGGLDNESTTRLRSTVPAETRGISQNTQNSAEARG